MCMEKVTKLNIGGGPKKIEGFLNVDAMEWEGITDIVMDLTKFPWKFASNSIDEIIAEEFLEHIELRFIKPILDECYRILKSGGTMKIQVPDCGKAMEYYVNNQICECVPHKARSYDGYKADEKCFACGGKGMINPRRWLFSFTGAQKHEYDIHRTIFTKDMMEDALKASEFRSISFEDNIYKIIVKVIKI